jgi:hypothetical protein
MIVQHGRNSTCYHRTKTELLDVITLHYCTAVGLIHVGVLLRPDHYTMFHLETKGAKKRKLGEVPMVTPQQIRKLLIVNGREISNQEELYDLFDLSELP